MTVGFGISPNLLTFSLLEKALAGSSVFNRNTAGGEFRPALKIIEAKLTLQIKPVNKKCLLYSNLLINLNYRMLHCVLL